MFEALLAVKYITSKNCFCLLSKNNFKHLQNKFVRIIHNGNESTCVSVVLSRGLVDDQSIGINSLFAKALGFEKSSLVAVTEIIKPPSIRSVTITTLNNDDYDVLENLAENVQETLLNQIQVLCKDDKFIIWIGNSIHVIVTVCEIYPISPGQIDHLTEVVIKPVENEVLAPQKIQAKHSFSFLDDYLNIGYNCILRVVPFKDLSDTLDTLLHPFNAFVSRQIFPKLKDTVSSPALFLLNVLSPDTEKSAYVRLYVLEDVVSDLKLTGCSEDIFLSDEVILYFGCGLGSRVLLNKYEGFYPQVQEIEIYTKKTSCDHIEEKFLQYLADSCKKQQFVLSSEVVFNASNNLVCYLRFLPCSNKFCFVTSDFVRNCKVLVFHKNVEKEEREQDDFCSSKFITNVVNYRDIIDKSVFLFVYNTNVFNRMKNVLITGKSATGKTTLTKIIGDVINSHPYYIYLKKINCKAIKGKTVESLHKLFTTIFLDLVHRQPSVLILDDLHIICERVNVGEGVNQQAVYFNRVSEMLEDLLKSFCDHNAIGVLASAESTTKLHKNIYFPRGNYLFKNVYKIDHLAKNDRRRILEWLFTNCEIDEADLDQLAEKTESFVMQDMVDLFNKTLFESYQQDPNQTKMKITPEHCEIALATVTETCLAGVNLHPPGDNSLIDVGGLTEAKKLLLETMLWPSKYPELFANPPLRLASGLLLYGAPGTGKTLLVGAAAKHCGLRLISIKGPELLSKFIGASEQAVRDVFQRAQSAKPCILFFDEFDSLAPRRGHDNTGVTDRVVNQLLTQLDGIESLSGVFVLAATSRPDLLDPALLRPGRLDIHIRCPLPDEYCRLDILKVLSKSLKLSPEVNLAKLAKRTEGFSGADLQAVLYTTQLESVKELDEANLQEFQPEIHQTQLMDALKSTRPSLSEAEQLKYEQIYLGFEGGTSKNFTPGTRATLA